jgi:hypothetical protein
MKHTAEETKVHPLDENYQDGIAAVARAGFDWVPIFGNSITELITSQLKNQWQHRATQFMKNLEDRLQSLPIEQLKFLLQNEAILSLIEKGALLAAKSVSQQKRDYIANLVSRGITQQDLKTEMTHVLLDVFSELNDSEIIWLIYIGKMKYSPNNVPKLSHDYLFYELHKEVLSYQNKSKPSDEELLMKDIQDWYKMRLISLGLIEKFNPVPNFYLITNLGRNLLSMIGIHENE